MKAILAAIVLLWMCLSVELAQAGQLPGHSLILPVACGVMFWFASGSGILIGGAVLVVDWIARPSPLPLAAIFVPCCAVLLMLPTSTLRPGYRRRRMPALPAAWRLPILTVIALALQLASERVMVVFQDPWQSLVIFGNELADTTMIAVPVSVAVAIAIHVANELGLRRRVL